VDFSDLSAGGIALAVEVCSAYGARLLLHHNRAAVQPGMARAWEWNEVHQHETATSEASAETQLRALALQLSPRVAVEASISSGPLGPVLLELAAQLPADLLVIGNHGWSTQDHASVTERLIDRSPCPVLTLHDGVSVGSFHLRAEEPERTAMVVPTDYSPSAEHAVGYAFEMARHVPVQLHLVHVLAPGAGMLQIEAAQTRLMDEMPSDLCMEPVGHVEVGEPTAKIVDIARRLQAACIVMGEHAHGVLRKLFTHDTARDVMHHAPCPVWFVPARI
jgi:universal stress protein A